MAYLEQRVDLNGGLCDAGKRTLGTLTSTAETTGSTGIVRDVQAGLLLELLLEVLQKVVVEILTTQVGVTSGSLDGEDTTSDVQKRDIESSSSQIEDEHVLLSSRLRVKTVSDSSGGGLVDDTENLESCNGTCILGSKTLGVVEVSRDAVSRIRYARKRSV